MQLGSKEDEIARFNHYLKKTYKKTASLIANSCKAVSTRHDLSVVLHFHIEDSSVSCSTENFHECDTVFSG